MANSLLNPDPDPNPNLSNNNNVNSNSNLTAPTTTASESEQMEIAATTVTVTDQGPSEGQPQPQQQQSSGSSGVDAVDINNIEIDIDLNASNSSSSNSSVGGGSFVIVTENGNSTSTEDAPINNLINDQDQNQNQIQSTNQNDVIDEPVQMEAEVLPPPPPPAPAVVEVPVDAVEIIEQPGQQGQQQQQQQQHVQLEVVRLDEEQEAFRQRFFQAILRRDAQPVESPPEYEEFDEDDNIDLIEEIMDDEDSYDGVSTGPPSSSCNSLIVELFFRCPPISWLRRKLLRARASSRSRRDDRDRDADSDGPADREEVSSVPVFDLQLPTRHSYLGDEMETLSGRTILEGGAIAHIPLVLLEFHLVPGQTLPLTIFHAATQSALRSCVPNNRHFGIVHSGLDDVNIRAPLPRRALGTTAEIYEFQEEREHLQQNNNNNNNNRFRQRQPPSVNIKAKGRHRFNVISTYRQSDGQLMAKVKVRPEINLPKPWLSIMSPSQRHLFPLQILPATEAPTTPGTGTGTGRRRSSTSSVLKRLCKSGAAAAAPIPDLEGQGHGKASDLATGNKSSSVLTELSGRLLMNRRKTKYYSALMGWPYFVYEQFDEELLVGKIHRKLSTDLSSLVGASVMIPQDATDLSFWLAQNLTMSDSLRLQMLKMDTPVERLRFANKLLDSVSHVIKCIQCDAVVGDYSDIFSMSVEGPQGTYVNPGGCIHEMVTLAKIRGIVYRGRAYTESSWFPGYSWRICECRMCGQHVGWKFEAVEKVKPTKFWGITRKSVSFKYDYRVEDECPDLDAPTTRTTAQSNSNSNTNNTDSTNNFSSTNNNHSRNQNNRTNNNVVRRNVSESSQENEII